ncbi:hypothetical protein [Brevundimonas sp. NIBR11]|uniref:hypothetical protein n=1 Tax=Brevundimonas sp. NIBR11 TaxID=3015999 RepID=UPI0022F05F55|nr:hypothetical protein [Brevundimonas sp. NIBR11]
MLARLASGDDRRQVLVLSPEANMQRLPPRDVNSALFEVKVGEAARLVKMALARAAVQTDPIVPRREA